MYYSWRSKTTSNKELIIQTNSGALLPVPAKKLLFTRQRWQISKRGLFPAFIKLICLPTRSKRTHTHTHTHRVISGTHKPQLQNSSQLTMATHPRAGTLSLTVERWLKSCELRFFSRNCCTSAISSLVGCRSLVNTSCRGEKPQSFTQMVDFSNFRFLFLYIEETFYTNKNILQTP